MGKVVQMKGWVSRKDKRTQLMSKFNAFLKKADQFFEAANKHREEINNGTGKNT